MRARKKELTRNRILDAAEELYSKKSLTEVSLDDIANAVIISRRTLYNYFKNKEDLFFAVGNRVFKRLNQTIASEMPEKVSGKDQVLFLCEKTFQDGEENPTVLKITRDFYDRINLLDISAEDINRELEEKLGPGVLNDILENPETSPDIDLEDLFEEPNFGEFFIQLLWNGEFWLNAMRKGKKDKSIKTDLPDMEIVLYLSMLMNGLLGEMTLRRADEDRMGIEKDIVIRKTLKLIAVFLEDQS